MKIGIDARMYGPAHSGLGRYVEQLIEQLQSIQSDDEYVVFLKQEAYDAFVLPNKKWKKVCTDVDWYGIAEQVLMPWYIRKEHVDIMHFPHWNVPILYRGPYVVTIHDLIMFHFSREDATTHGRFVYAIKDSVHRMLVQYVARRAIYICTTSEFTKQDIVKTLHTQPKKIRVTYQAPFVYKNAESTPDADVLQKYNITGPYILYVGNAYPHKNLKRLINAFQDIEQDGKTTYQLVLAGKQSPWYTAVEESVGYDDRIVCTGFVPDDDLDLLYQQARLYVFPSLYEGFGLPPLEAMVHGIPVVSSNASCLPEVLGSGAIYFDPEDIKDITRALTMGIYDEEARYMVRQNAKQELMRYSSKRLGQQTYRIYQEVLR